jgi:RNA polymerase-binding transcription factor DksA
VVEPQGELVGILSETDALRALASLLSRETHPSAAAPGADEGLVDALRSERKRLAEQLARWQEAERTLSADPGQDPSSAAVLEPLSARAARRLRAIELALDRAERGRFGICERCHGHIPATRLRAVPEATLCMRCARPDARIQGEES